MQRFFADLKLEIKSGLNAFFGTSDALIHVNVGLALFLILALSLYKTKYNVLIAWAVLLLLQIGNEVLDARIGLTRDGWMNLGEAWRDCVATLFWPTVFMLIWTRLRRSSETRES